MQNPIFFTVAAAVVMAFVLPLVALPTAAGAQGAPDKPVLTAPLVVSDVVDAPPQQVWQAFTTKQGQESWQVSHADVDLRVGGLMRTQYAKEGRLGDENTINNLILSYDPDRMLSIRIVQPPKNFPFKKAAEVVWTVVYFEPVETTKTRVTVSMIGWDNTEESQKMRAFFSSGNRWTLDKLKAHFSQPVKTSPTETQKPSL